MTGSPDFQQYAQWQGSNLLPAYSQVLAPGVTRSGVQTVASWSGVEAACKPSAGYGLVTVHWWADAGEATEIRSDTWAVNALGGLAVRIPVFGPFCSMDINVTSPGNMTARTTLRGINNAAPQFNYPMTQSVIAVSGKSVAAAATDLTFLPYIRKGPASLFFAPSDTAGKLLVILEVANPDSSQNYQIAGLGNPTGIVNQPVVLPDDLTALKVINQSATTAHAYTAALIPS